MENLNSNNTHVAVRRERPSKPLRYLQPSFDNQIMCPGGLMPGNRALNSAMKTKPRFIVYNDDDDGLSTAIHAKKMSVEEKKC